MLMQTTTEPTVGQLVVERPARAKIFERFGIDYCCGGRKPLSAACAEKNLSLDTVLEALAESDAPAAVVSRADTERNWATASMTDLCDHIEQTHHIYLKRDLPRMEMLIDKVVNAHGAKDARLARLRQTFLGLRDEILSHLMKEEQILFPMCRAMDQADGPVAFHCGSVASPIEVMIREHDDAGDALEQMRALTDDYTPPAEACNTWRAMCAALEELEQDMHQHVHKENNILFPKAIRAENNLRR